MTGHFFLSLYWGRGGGWHRGSAVLLFVKGHAAEARHSQPEAKTGAASLSGCVASNTGHTGGSYHVTTVS